MKTINTEQWGDVWRRDMARYDSVAVLNAVKEELASVRCQKIIGYLDTFLGDLTGKRVVEIGCGGAIYSLIFAQRGASPTLLDYSHDALTLANRNLDAVKVEGELMHADAFQPPPELLGRFDVAMSFGTVEHYRYPRRLAICESHVNLVKPGGVVVISTPNKLFLPHEILKVLLAARRKWFLGYEGSFSRREMRQVGQKLGLQNVEIVGSSWRADLRRYVRIVRETRTFRRCFSFLGEPDGSSVPAPQTHHWMDDFVGHDIVLLGVRRRQE